MKWTGCGTEQRTSKRENQSIGKVIQGNIRDWWDPNSIPNMSWKSWTFQSKNLTWTQTGLFCKGPLIGNRNDEQYRTPRITRPKDINTPNFIYRIIFEMITRNPKDHSAVEVTSFAAVQPCVSPLLTRFSCGGGHRAMCRWSISDIESITDDSENWKKNMGILMRDWVPKDENKSPNWLNDTGVKRFLVQQNVREIFRMHFVFSSNKVPLV